MEEERFTHNHCVLEVGKPLMVIKDNGQPIDLNRTINLLNEFYKDNKELMWIIENQSYIIQQLHMKLLEHQLKEPIRLTVEDIEMMGEAISYYTHGRMPE